MYTKFNWSSLYLRLYKLNRNIIEVFAKKHRVIDSSGNELHLYQRGKEQHFYWTAKNAFLAFVLLGLFLEALETSILRR